VADSKPSKTTKRRLRAATPTVRQAAEKAQISAKKPARVSPVKKAARATGKPLKAAAKPFIKVAPWFDRQPFRFIGKILCFVGKILGRIVWPRFVRESFGQLRQVEWPSFGETTRLTFAVLVFAIIFGVLITGVDYGLDKLFRAIILKK
jgi:preprotein translocase SecE subunit